MKETDSQSGFNLGTGQAPSGRHLVHASVKGSRPRIAAAASVAFRRIELAASVDADHDACEGGKWLGRQTGSTPHIEGTIGGRNAFGQQGDEVIVKSWTRLGVACRDNLVDERIYDQPRNHVVMFRAVCRQIPSKSLVPAPTPHHPIGQALDQVGTQTRAG